LLLIEANSPQVGDDSPPVPGIEPGVCAFVFHDRSWKNHGSAQSPANAMHAAVGRLGVGRQPPRLIDPKRGGIVFGSRQLVEKLDVMRIENATRDDADAASGL